ncbi:MAG: sigma-70 family RNA polymerase sigma factor [Planctomycetaceae bacterium]|nr:sigma-70 family RNA polymerase sigma factor [Planctomycetaceae bacterium]
MSESLLNRVAAGQPAAVAECLKRYTPLVWSIARRLCHDQTEAEDGVQEVFIDLWKNAERFDAQRGSEDAFVATIARRRLIDRLRKQDRQLTATELSPEISATQPSVESCLQSREESEKIRRAMQQLKQEERRVLELAILQGCSQQEISRCLEMPLGTVKSHARRGIQRLKELVGPETPGANR